jgi:GNAT superfamily N-acetyltransferase
VGAVPAVVIGAALAGGSDAFLVARRGGHLVGFSAIKATMLLALYVDPAHGRGAGRVLLQAAEAEARAGHVDRLSLQATLNAVGFHSRQGYSADGPDAVLRGRASLTVMNMHKDLALQPVV